MIKCTGWKQAKRGVCNFSCNMGVYNSQLPVKKLQYKLQLKITITMATDS